MAQQESSRKWTWVWIVVALLVLGGGIFFLQSGRDTVPIRTAVVEPHDIVIQVPTNGKVVPKVDFQAHAPVSGEVKNLFVKLNQNVKAGQLLLQLDDANARRDVAADEASVASAENNMNSMLKGGNQEEHIAANADLTNALASQKQAQDSLKTMEKLQAQGAASQNEVVSSRQRLDEANTRVTQLKTRRTNRYSEQEYSTQRAQVLQAHAALASANAELASVVVRAPFDGTVYAIPVSKYDFVQGGQALLDVADLSKLEIFAYFDEPEVGRLAVGQPVKIVWDAKQGKVWNGHILEAPTTIITYGTRNVGECIITVDDANGDLLPNTNVTVTVTTMLHPNVLSVPREALHTDGGVNYVYRVDKDHLVKTPVQVGALNLILVEITGGLKAGDTVALGAKTETELSDGLPVKVAN
jgi:HlyD family secretion protein